MCIATCKNVQNCHIFAHSRRIEAIRGVLSSPWHGGCKETDSKEHERKSRVCADENPFAQFAFCAIGLQIAIAQIAQTVVS